MGGGGEVSRLQSKFCCESENNMSLPYARAPHTTGSSATQPEAPNAALLIDFDNVTMGMRSDLSKELKTLLNSDIIKGKVTVQRAYADWRRYPQYIVPLSENSVDLIFAPAYGSSKKNATDIRMAIDGMELVFIRPEIGTFILLTGDSDFSSLVLKLKEYGKYVIGVGIQESSSDILVQNCDEYYSYTSLSGLRKTTDSANKSLDPWVLVEEAVKKMDARNDVMRSDRLKQVMIEIDPSFDEGNFGYSKFSKFLSEAAGRDLVSLRKMENGQYEIQPQGKEKHDGGGRGRGGPSRRQENRDRSRGERSGDGERGRSRADASAKEKEKKGPPPKEEPSADKPRKEEDPLRAAYDLLCTALGRLTEGNGGGPARDSDLKRKMLEIEPSFDEGELGFGKFSRFLRQAHDHEVIDLEKREEGTYQVSLRTKGESDTQPSKAPTRDVDDGSSPVGMGPQEKQEKQEKQEDSGKKGWGLGVRLGERGRHREPDGPPPILEGQVVHPDGQSGAGSRGETTGETASKTGPGAPVDSGDVDIAALGLPTGRAAVIRYLTNSYKGVGKKTAESLADSFGSDLFPVLQQDPDRISSVVAGKRAEQLLEAWRADYQRRMERAARNSPPNKGTDPQEEISFSGGKDGKSEEGQDGGSNTKAPPKRRTRKGGRGRRQ